MSGLAIAEDYFFFWTSCRLEPNLLLIASFQWSYRVNRSIFISLVRGKSAYTHLKGQFLLVLISMDGKLYVQELYLAYFNWQRMIQEEREKFSKPGCWCLKLLWSDVHSASLFYVFKQNIWIKGIILIRIFIKGKDTSNSLHPIHFSQLSKGF